MPDDLIHCPACNFQLRLPHELYGSPVECPQCHTQFTAPVPAVPAVRPVAAPPPGREYDASPRPPVHDYYAPQPGTGSTLKAPGVILLILSGAAMLLSVYSAVTAEAGVRQLHKLAADPDMPPQWAQYLKQMADNTDPETVRWSHLVLAGLNLVTALGAMQMLRQQTYWLAIIGAVLALNPLNCPCCLGQVPVGIWALVALLSESGRRAFR
jgi:hypothetical protein